MVVETLSRRVLPGFNWFYLVLASFTSVELGYYLFLLGFIYFFLVLSVLPCFT